MIRGEGPALLGGALREERPFRRVAPHRVRSGVSAHETRPRHRHDHRRGRHDAALVQGRLPRLAVAAHDGIARAIVPAHIALPDGDLVSPRPPAIPPPRPAPPPGAAELLEIGHAAATCLARCDPRAVHAARRAPGDVRPTWSQRFGAVDGVGGPRATTRQGPRCACQEWVACPHGFALSSPSPPSHGARVRLGGRGERHNPVRASTPTTEGDTTYATRQLGLRAAAHERHVGLLHAVVYAYRTARRLDPSKRWTSERAFAIRPLTPKGNHKLDDSTNPRQPPEGPRSSLRQRAYVRGRMVSGDEGRSFDWRNPARGERDSSVARPSGRPRPHEPSPGRRDRPRRHGPRRYREGPAEGVLRRCLT